MDESNKKRKIESEQDLSNDETLLEVSVLFLFVCDFIEHVVGV